VLLFLKIAINTAWKICRACRAHCLLCNCQPSVAMAKADVFQKNVNRVGREFAKILKIFDNIDEVKAEGSFKRLKEMVVSFLSY
jgi:hypothetical protein